MNVSHTDIYRDLRSRLLLLDGATGTMIQRLKLTDKDFHGSLLAAHPTPLYGNNEILVLTRPADILAIHREYLHAGADIISTNTFNANAVSQSRYNTERLVGRLNLEAARLAREAADIAMAESLVQSGEFTRKYVAGSIGPTDRIASENGGAMDSSKHLVSFDVLKDAYTEQIAALREGGVDLLLFETFFNTANIRAALTGACEAMRLMNRELPVIVSVTVSNHAGILPGGQSLEEIVDCILPWKDFLLAVGLNCSFGPEAIGLSLRRLAEFAPLPLSCHPNAGMPDATGEYTTDSVKFATAMDEYISEGLLNIAGGCCGTTPEYIRRLSGLKNKRFRIFPE